jgi:hypothetical protein
MEPLLGQMLKDHCDRAVAEAPPSSGPPVAPKDQLLLAIARFICLANEILGPWGEVLKLEAARQASKKRKEAIAEGCYVPPFYPPPAPTYGRPESATGAAVASGADYAWPHLAALLQACTCALQQWAATTYKQPYTAPEKVSTDATEEEQKPASPAARSGQK